MKNKKRLYFDFFQILPWNIKLQAHNATYSGCYIIYTAFTYLSIVTQQNYYNNNGYQQINYIRYIYTSQSESEKGW